MSASIIKAIKPLSFPWETSNPFLFCVYHADAYPKGNKEMGPVGSLAGRNIGQDFTLKDGWRMYHGEKVPGFPSHPHRGFETVTVVEEGLVDHADSLGGAGRYGNGDVQWMTAGAGIQHSEMFPLLKEDKDNPLVLFQIWLNLPKSRKFANPYYAMLWHEKIPVVTMKDGDSKNTFVKLVAGELNGAKALNPAPDSWAADPENEVAIWVIRMEAGASFIIPAASALANRTLYFYEGASVKIGEETLKPDHSASLTPDQDALITNGPEDGSFLFLQGKPINEKVVHYGPFVMNTDGEIQQAMLDYQKTRFGGWPWPRHDMVHERSEGRFANYGDGREERPE
jgi:redox-sensitive bicupin YhaK (pirin superfamily)